MQALLGNLRPVTIQETHVWLQVVDIRCYMRVVRGPSALLFVPVFDVGRVEGSRQGGLRQGLGVTRLLLFFFVCFLGVAPAPGSAGKRNYHVLEPGAEKVLLLSLLLSLCGAVMPCASVPSPVLDRKAELRALRNGSVPAPESGSPGSVNVSYVTAMWSFPLILAALDRDSNNRRYHNPN